MDESQFREFYRDVHPMMLRYAARRLDIDSANEVAIDVLRTVWVKGIKFPTSDPDRRRLMSLCYKICDGLILNARRADQRRAALVEAAGSHLTVVAEPAVDLHEQETLPEALASLKEKDKHLLRLVADGYGTSEIADILGVSPAAATMRLQRVKAKARRLMASVPRPRLEVQQ